MLLRDAHRGGKTKEKSKTVSASKIRGGAALGQEVWERLLGGWHHLYLYLEGDYVGLPFRVIGYTIHLCFMHFPACKLIIQNYDVKEKKNVLVIMPPPSLQSMAWPL